MNYYTDVLKKYTVFNGRASRKEYWMFFLFNLLIMMALGIINSIIFHTTKTNLLGNLYDIAVFLPCLALTIRRLHDTNRTGWWALLNLIPIIGWIWILILMILEGTPTDNQYGPNPKITPSTVV